MLGRVLCCNKSVTPLLCYQLCMYAYARRLGVLTSMKYVMAVMDLESGNHVCSSTPSCGLIALADQAVTDWSHHLHYRISKYKWPSQGLL